MFIQKVSRLNQTSLTAGFDYRIPTTANATTAGLLTYIAGTSGGVQVLDINIKGTVLNVPNTVRVYLARKDLSMGTWTENSVNQDYNEIHLIDEINIMLPQPQPLSITNSITKQYSNLFITDNWALLLGAAVINNTLTVYSSTILNPQVYRYRSNTNTRN